jgi:hypothetical protein
MEGSRQERVKKPEGLLFDKLLGVREKTEFKKYLAEEESLREIRELADSFSNNVFKGMGEKPDLRTLKALYQLMPAILDRINREPTDPNTELPILAPMEMPSRTFLSALTLAAHGTGISLQGYVEGVSVVANPETATAELIEDFQMKWLSGTTQVD